MAFLREYELNERDDVLIVHFFYNETDESETFVIRFHLKIKNLFVYRYKFCSNSIVLDEVRRLFDFVERPYWKSIARLVTSDHRFKDPTIDGLF